MIKNVVFDIGDVLMHFTWNEYIYDLFTGDKEKIDAVNEAINSTGLWLELDRNVIPIEDIFYKMRNYNPAYWKDVVLALENAKDCFNRCDYAIPWIKSVKEKGYKVYYLSNYSTFNLNVAPEVLDFLPYMDGGIFSCDVHVLKPKREIYELLCKKYDLVPSECIFIDDRPENVAAAIEFGMQAIQFTKYEEIKTALEKLLTK